MKLIDLGDFVGFSGTIMKTKTGEITLRGKVLAVGGIKEKILAAKRSGIKEIILCKDNQKDIAEINKKYFALHFLCICFAFASFRKGPLESGYFCRGNH